MHLHSNCKVQKTHKYILVFYKHNVFLNVISGASFVGKLCVLHQGTLIRVNNSLLFINLLHTGLYLFQLLILVDNLIIVNILSMDKEAYIA